MTIVPLAAAESAERALRTCGKLSKNYLSYALPSV